jgi:hypothetical protein
MSDGIRDQAAKKVTMVLSGSCSRGLGHTGSALLRYFARYS